MLIVSLSVSIIFIVWAVIFSKQNKTFIDGYNKSIKQKTDEWNSFLTKMDLEKSKISADIQKENCLGIDPYQKPTNYKGGICSIVIRNKKD